MDDAECVQVPERERHLCDVEPDDVFLHAAESVEVEPQVASEHQIQHHEQVLVVLKGEPHVAHERRVDLFEQPSLLDDLPDEKGASARLR